MFMNTSNGARSSECLTQADRNSERPSEHYTNLKVENPHHPPIVTEGERVQGGGSGGRGGVEGANIITIWPRCSFSINSKPPQAQVAGYMDRHFEWQGVRQPVITPWVVYFN